MAEFVRLLGSAIRILAGWVAPLLFLAFMFHFGLRLVRHSRAPETRLAARAGLIAGLAMWVYVVYRFPPATIVAGLASPKQPWFVGLGLILIALAVGFGFMKLVERWAQTPAVGLLVLVLSFTSTSAAYNYVFASTSRDVLLTCSLFVLVGAMMRVIRDPRNLAEIFRHRRADAPQ